MKTIRLEKEFVLRLYYFTDQACRSLHKALGGPWHEFREFYSADRIESLRDLLNELRSLTGPGRRVYQVDEPIDWRSSWATLLEFVPGGHWLNRWKRTFAFSDEQLGYLAFLLESFLHVLDCSDRPATSDKLIALRMALSACAALLDQCGASELLRGYGQIEHFWRTERIPPIYLEELLQRAGLPARGALALHGK